MGSKKTMAFEIQNRTLLPNDVLPNKELQENRYTKLQKAMYLWNSMHEKSKISFKSDEGVTSLDTSIWFVSEKYVCIYGGITILVSCILDVI